MVQCKYYKLTEKQVGSLIDTVVELDAKNGIFFSLRARFTVLTVIRSIYTFILFQSELTCSCIQVSNPVTGIDVDTMTVTTLEVCGSSAYSENAFNSLIEKYDKKNLPQILSYRRSEKCTFTYNRWQKKIAHWTCMTLEVFLPPFLKENEEQKLNSLLFFITT